MIYKGKVFDGPAVASRLAPGCFPWPRPHFPVCVLTINFEETMSPNGVLINPGEASVMSCLARQLMCQASQHLLCHQPLRAKDFCVLTPYAGQAQFLKKMVPSSVEVAVLDRFQGQERKVVIYGTMRSNPEKKLGFVSDRRRFNVALTRACDGLIVIVNRATVGSDLRTWGTWLDWADKLGIVRPAEACVSMELPPSF